MEGGNVSSIGNTRAKEIRQRSEYLKQMNKERFQKLKKLIWNKLCMKRFGHKHSHQSKITNYFEAEEKNSIDIKQNEDGDKSGRAINEDESKKTYPDVSQHYKRKKKKDGKKCWVCKSYHHLKMNCPKIHCFYCGKSGHIKANCWIKKMCYIFSKLKEKEDQKDKRKEKKRKNKEKKKQRRKGLEIIDQRVQYMGTYLKKDKKGKEEYFVKWKDIELGQYTGSGSPAQTISNFLEHKYKFIFVLLKRNTP